MQEQTQGNKMYVNSNSKAFKFQLKIISDYEFLLSILNAFTVETEEYYPKCSNANDANSLQIPYHYCSITLTLRGCKL